MSNKNLLKTAEFSALLATGAGAIAAEVFKQSLLLSGPLSLTLFLSLLNRRQSDQAIQSQTEQDIRQLRQDFYQLDNQILQDMKVLRRDVLASVNPPEAIGPQEMKARLEAPSIDADVLSIAEIAANPSPPAIAATHLHRNADQEDTELLEPLQLVGAASDLRSEIDFGILPDGEPLVANAKLPAGEPPVTKAEEHPLQPQLSQLAQQLQQFSQQWEQAAFDRQFASLRANIHLLEQKLEQKPGSVPESAANLDLIDQKLNALYQVLQQQIHQKLGTIHEQVMTLTQAFNPNPLEAAHFVSLEQRIDNLATIVQTLYHNQSDTSEIIALDRRVAQQTEVIQRLENQVAMSTAASHADETNLATLAAAVKGLYHRQTQMEQDIVQTLQSEMGQRFNGLAALNLNELHSKLDRLSEDIRQLQIQPVITVPATGLPAENLPVLVNGNSTHLGANSMGETTPTANRQPEDIAHAIMRLEQETNNPVLKQHLSFLASALYTVWKAPTDEDGKN